MSLTLVNGKRFDPIFDATLGPALAWSVAHWLNCHSQGMDHAVEKDGPASGGNKHTLGSRYWPGGSGVPVHERVGISDAERPFVMLFLEDGSTNLRNMNLYFEALETVRVLVCHACEMWQMGETGCQLDGGRPFEGPH